MIVWVDFKLGPRGGCRRRATLDGRVYILDVLWSPGESVWALTISTATGEIIRAGRWLRTGSDALAGVADSTRPPGSLIPVDTSNRDLDPGRDDLRASSAVRLQYASPGAS